MVPSPDSLLRIKLEASEDAGAPGKLIRQSITPPMQRHLRIGPTLIIEGLNFKYLVRRSLDLYLIEESDDVEKME